MKRLSKGVEELIAQEKNLKEQADGKAHVHDAVIVGSGYGGAVSALRLSELGCKVIVLERGEEWSSNEFPNDIGNAFGAVRLERNSATRVMGSESGLFDLRVGGNFGALVGNGLGGTSLINANVVLEPDSRVFDKQIAATNDSAQRAAWPLALQSNGNPTAPILALDYSKAKKALGAECFSNIEIDGPPNQQGVSQPFMVIPQKLTRHKELANNIYRAAGKSVEVIFDNAWLTVALRPDLGTVPGPVLMDRCVGCGDCVSGCNQNAKKSLDKTYLAQAKVAGAKFFTGVSVLSVERAPRDSKDEKTGYWVVRYVQTAARSKLRQSIPLPVHEIHAKHVVLSAGTFGSTEILMRSKNLGLGLSDQLGQRISTNGDALAFGYMLDQPVHGVGMGSRLVTGTRYGVGPTITSNLKIRHKHNVEKSVLIQEGAVPGAIAGLFHEMVTTAATLAQLDSCDYKSDVAQSGNGLNTTDWAVLQRAGLENTQTLLVMGHDNSLGKIEFDTINDKILTHYKVDRTEAAYLEQNKYLALIEQQGAIFIQNPVLDPVPTKLSAMLETPTTGKAAFTVHPLGGCCMADDIKFGVVNDIGQVFMPSNGAANGASVWEGLYVLDGSIIPTSLGANPLLTITALAERAMTTIGPMVQPVAPRAATIAPPSSAVMMSGTPLLPNPADYLPLQAPYLPYSREVKVHFSEAMRGEIHWYGKKQQAHLLLHMPINDLDMFWQDGIHKITIPKQQGLAPGDKEQLPACLRLDFGPAIGLPNTKPQLTTQILGIASGSVSILPVPHLWFGTRIGAYIRTFWTWLVERGFHETIRNIGLRFVDLAKVQNKTKNKKTASLCSQFLSMLKMFKHSSEVRVMEYRLDLFDDSAIGQQAQVAYQLIGRKHVGYPASWGALLRRPFPGMGYLDRLNVWESFTTMAVEIRDMQGNCVGHGRLTFDLLDMTKMHAPQLGLQRDTPTALLALAGYPLWFARLMLKTRLFDFRLPDYPQNMPVQLSDKTPPIESPVPDAALEHPTPWPSHFPCLRIADGNGGFSKRIKAEPPISFCVTRSKHPNVVNEKVELKLIRYKQPKIEQSLKKDGIVRVKTLLMLNGFAQSTLGFVPQEHIRRITPAHYDLTTEIDEPGLAEFFYEQGFDIWLFDYRTSSLLDSSKLPCSMDEIAEFDIPAAVDCVLAEMRNELKKPAQEQIQIYAFAHCVGAASLAMSMLGGFLQYPKVGGKDAADSSVGKIAGVTFSQMQAFLVGSESAQQRLQVGGILRDALGIDYLRLSGAERQPTAFESMLDRLFASLPVTEAERCPHENNRYKARPGICTCKRMSGTISRLLKHDMIKEETHDRLPVYFGRANTSLLVHGGRCVENERLVNADGQNVYVTDENIKNHFRIPIAILHGKHNALFDVTSARRTFDQLARVNADLPSTTKRKNCQCVSKNCDCDNWVHGDDKAYDLIIAEDYAHFDCTIGFGPRMKDQILDPLKAFYAKAWQKGSVWPTSKAKEFSNEIRSEAKAPLAGPIIGWSRMEKNIQGSDFRLLRLWIEVDETGANPAKNAVTLIRKTDGSFVSAQLWPIVRIPLDDSESWVAIALADIEFQLPADVTDYSVQMFSVHEFCYTAAAGTAISSKFSGEPIAPPITPKELQEAMKRSGHMPGFGATPMGGTINWSQTFSCVQSPNTANPSRATPKFLFPVQICPGGALKVETANLLLETLNERDRITVHEALCGKPASPSRKSRFIPAPRDGFRYTAHIPAAIISAPKDWQDLKFLASCCRHPGLAFEDKRADASFDRISALLQSDRQRHRDFMFMLGDQIYADATGGILESPSAIEKITLRYRHAFNTRGFNAVTAQLPTYMVIDDHEIADNWSQDDCLAAKQSQRYKARKLHQAGMACFAAYQASHSPGNSPSPGFNYTFEQAGFAFFVLDTRTERRRFGKKSKAPQMISDEQLTALGNWLAQAKQHDSRPKFIVTGSVFAPGLRQWQLPGHQSDPMAESWQMAVEQRERVLAMIQDNQVKNIVFLSGDYHCDATATLEFAHGLAAYAIVTPPLYAPLPGANAKSTDVIKDEVIGFARGTVVKITSTAREGSGFADIHVASLPENQWKLSVNFYRLQLDTKNPDFELETREFLLK
jgi:cholesterol oxidase